MTEFSASPTPTPEHGVATPELIIEDGTILERHPDWPKLNVLFQFGPHGTQKDFKPAAASVKEADIYLMELASPDNAEYRRTLQRWVADARFVPKALSNLLVDPRMQPVIDELRGSRKAIGVMDIPGTAHELRRNLIATLTSLPVDDSFEESVRHSGEIIARRSELQEQREQLMVRAFENEIERILEERPELKDKPELNVAITMGTYHTRVRHSLAKAGVVSERNLPTSPTFTYNYTYEAMRTYAYGRTPSEELLEKAWTEQALSKATTRTLERYGGSSVALSHYERALTGKLTHGQRVEIYEIIKEDPGVSKNTVEKIDTYLRQNQIGKLPRSTREVESAFAQSPERNLARQALADLTHTK